MAGPSRWMGRAIDLVCNLQHVEKPRGRKVDQFVRNGTQVIEVGFCVERPALCAKSWNRADQTFDPEPVAPGTNIGCHVFTIVVPRGFAGGGVENIPAHRFAVESIGPGARVEIVGVARTCPAQEGQDLSCNRGIEERAICGNSQNDPGVGLRRRTGKSRQNVRLRTAEAINSVLGTPGCDGVISRQVRCGHPDIVDTRDCARGIDHAREHNAITQRHQNLARET